MRFLLLGDFRQLPAVLDSFAGTEVCRELKDSQLLHDLASGWCHELSERWRFDEGVFSFLQWLRVDEAEQVPLRDAVQMARQRFPRNPSAFYEEELPAEVFKELEILILVDFMKENHLQKPCRS